MVTVSQVPRVAWLALFALIFACDTTPASADDDETAHSPAIAERAEQQQQAPAQVNDDEEAAQKAFVVGAAGLVLILLLVVGVMLVAGVIVWGRRARRLARQPLPSVSAPDRLWYLRQSQSKTEAGNTPSNDEADSEDDTEVSH